MISVQTEINLSELWTPTNIMNLLNIASCLAIAVFLSTANGDPEIHDGQVRLDNKGDTNTNAGLVEVWHYGKWGLVCHDDSWNMNAASVACRSVGFSAAADVASYGDYLDPGADQPSTFWLTGVSCDGDELHLKGCVEQAPTGPASCPGNKMAAVICSGGKKEMDIYDDFKLRAVQLLLDLLQESKK